MRILSLSANSTSVSARYVGNGAVELKNKQIVTDTGKSLFFTSALSGASDARINNFSALFLTTKTFASSLFNVDEVDNSLREVITTYLVGDAPGAIIDSSRYLFIDEVPDASQPYITTYSLKLSADIPIDIDNRKYFEVELLDEKLARVMHRDNTFTYYLAYNDTGTSFYFITGADVDDITVPGIDRNTFYYVLDRPSSRISLFRQASGGSGLSSFLSISGNKLTFSTATSSQTIAINTLNSFAIRYNAQTIDIKLNNGWASYDPIGGNNNANIDISRTITDIKTNYLASFQYSAISGNTVEMNLMALKNTESEKGFNNRSSYLERNAQQPGVNYRDYSSIFSGSNQELGNDVITLNYEFYTADYVMTSDGNTLFKTPKNMYPYDRININDTYLAINGGFAGDTPFNSDKVWRRKENSNILDNDSQFLCTWLSGGDIAVPPIWVDRYYYPERTTFAEAISTANASTYTDTIQSIINDNSELTADIGNLQFFDKKSDMVFEPDTEYIYSRVGDEFVSQYMELLGENIISDGLNLVNSRNVPADPTDLVLDRQQYNFDGDHKAVITNYDELNQNNSQYTISFWANFKDWDSTVGHQIMGNLNDHGIGVVNDARITPILTVHSGQTVYFFNSDFSPIHQTDIGATIRHILRTDHLDLLIVIDEDTQLYKLKVNGPIVDKVDLSALAGYRHAVIDSSGNIDFLMDENGTVKSFNIYTEVITTLNADQTTQIRTGSIVKDLSGTLRSFVGDKAIQKTTEDAIFLVNDNLLVQESLDHSTRSLLISSTTNIRDFTLDENNNIYVLHNDDRITKFNENRDKLYTVSMSGTTLSAVSAASVAVDIVNEYTIDGHKTYPIIMSVDTDDNLHLTKIEETLFKAVSTTSLGVSGAYTGFITASAAKRYNVANYAWLKNRYRSVNNTITFHTKLKNNFNNRDFLATSTEIDISEYTSGYHHFVYRFDGVHGNISLFVDADLVSNTKIPIGKYAMQTTVDDCLGFGSTLFYNCESLSELLDQPQYYFINDVSLKQVKTYDKSLYDTEVNLLHFNNASVEDITLSLPSGQRNALDEMSRMFKWRLPGHKASSVNIRVKNSKIVNSEIQEKLEHVIRAELNKVAASDLDIDKVVFEQF